MTIGSEYIPVPGLTFGLDVTYYEDVLWSEGNDEAEPADTKSVVTYGLCAGPSAGPNGPELIGPAEWFSIAVW